MYAAAGFRNLSDRQLRPDRGDESEFGEGSSSSSNPLASTDNAMDVEESSGEKGKK